MPKPCRDYLTEPDWTEGFTCSRPAGHSPPHRAEGEGIGEINLRYLAARLYADLADEPFWCDTCRQQHPLREHRECRS